MTDALVLSGGSVKGAYQAGVIQGLYEQGFRPEIVTGISVGALNAAYLAAHPGDGKGLADFWRTKVTSPDAVVKKRGVIDLLYRILTKSWKGAVSTDPLVSLVRKELSPFLPVTINPEVATRVGAVNMRTGRIEYYSSVQPHFLDAVIASTAEPIAMPTRRIGPDHYYDGGLRDIAPLKQAILLGATRIVAVLCQPETLGDWRASGDLLAIAGRVAGIVSHEIIENDIATCRKVNQTLPPGKRHIDLHVIRPAEGFDVDVSKFTGREIHEMVDRGYLDGLADWHIMEAA
jgi:NTE family protein